MTVRRSGPRVPVGQAEIVEMGVELREDDARPRRRPSNFETLLDRVDSGLAREHAGDAELAAVQAFAFAWAVLGYVVWIVLWVAAMLIVLLLRALSSPWRSRDDDEGWTTTMKRKGRVR